MGTCLLRGYVLARRLTHSASFLAYVRASQQRVLGVECDEHTTQSCKHNAPRVNRPFDALIFVSVFIFKVIQCRSKLVKMLPERQKA